MDNTHTDKEASDLWCPMARVAQVGAAETQAAYNRVLNKVHIPVKLAESPEGEPEHATILKTSMDLSGAARCIGSRCAAWRWHIFPPLDEEPRGACGLAPL